MGNRYRRKEVLEALRTMLLGVCDTVYTSSRETVTTTKDKFIIIKLPQGITPVSKIHNTAYVQLHLFAKDVANGVESVNKQESLTDGVCALIPFNTELMSCNDIPLVLESKSDGMGYHYIIMQFRIVIKV